MSELNEQQEQQDPATPPEALPEGEALETTEVVETPEAKEEPPEDIETLRKRLADTQRWAHQLNQERQQELRQRQQQDEAKRLTQLQDGVDPEVLGTVDKAIEAREIRARQEQERKQRAVVDAIHEVEPDIEALQANPLFTKALDEQAAKILAAGKDPMNPIHAVKAVIEARKQFEMSQARTDAEAAEKARKTSKMAAMNVPGSAAASHAKGKTPEDEAAAVWNMSAEEFAKAKQKARGF